MTQGRDKLYLNHMLEAATAIEAFLKDTTKEKFMPDDYMQSAVIRKFEILGEAVKRVSKETKIAHPGVKWKKIAGMRDVLIHDYFGLDLWGIWKTAQTNVPTLKRQLKKILVNGFSK